MSDDLKELRKIAEAATPGPWEWDEPSKDEWPMEDQSLIQSEGDEPILSGWGYDASGTLAEDVDRTHIATFDPPTVLALLSRLEQAEQDRVKLRNRLDAMRRQRDGYRNQIRKARTNQGENNE
ncbi:hypothetical protein GEO19_22475 [Escherichia coli OP50]|nr:hypothetical protein [Escherichia coli OP50]